MDPELEEILQNRNLAILRIGAMRENVRVLLGSPDSRLPELTIAMTGVVKLFHRVGPLSPVRVLQLSEVGSFGWNIENREEYVQLKLASKDASDSTCLLAIARSILHRPLDNAHSDINYPG